MANSIQLSFATSNSNSNSDISIWSTIASTSDSDTDTPSTHYPGSTDDDSAFKVNRKSNGRRSRFAIAAIDTPEPASTSLKIQNTHRHRKSHIPTNEQNEDPLEEYFLQQAKLFRHLEKRYTKFNKKSREEQARARQARQARKAGQPKAKPVKQQQQQQLSKSNQRDMFGSGVATRGAVNVGRSVVRPAISITRVPSPVSAASFSTTSSVDARALSKLKKKPKRKVNPDAMPVIEAARVLRALEAASPSATYSLTLSTKVHKSSLPIRGTVSLPLDPRRTSEVILVFAESNSLSATLAKEAGAAYVGAEELFESVLNGKISPTRCLATPGMMPLVSRALARYLGPKGLMPVAKRGLVGEGEELAEKIRGAAGRMEYRADKQGLVRLPVARMDFEIPSVENNIRAFIQTIRDEQSSSNTDDAVTAAAQKKKKGSAIVGARLETTNGPSIELNDVL